MNKAVKIILTVSLGILFVGILSVILGIKFGGKAGWGFDLATMKYSDQTETVENTVDLDDFDSLDIEVSSMDVMIKHGDSYRLEYKAEEGREPVIEQKGGKLKITQPSGGSFKIGINLAGIDEHYTIVVPDGADVIKLDARLSSGDLATDHVNISGKIHASSGDILLSDVEGDELDVSASSGEIGCDKIKVKEAKFDVSSGDIKINRIFADEVKCETSSGDIAINDSETKDLYCKASSGEIEVALNGSEADYSYELKATSGDIKVNGVEVEDKYEKDNGKDSKITLRSTSGDIKLDIR